MQRAGEMLVSLVAVADDGARIPGEDAVGVDRLAGPVADVHRGEELGARHVHVAQLPRDPVRRVITETGVLKGRRRRAVDSTILADAVATQDTITQLVAAIRRCSRLVPGAAELIASVCTGHDYRSPGKPRIDWDDPAAKDALVSALVNDANALVRALEGRDLDEQASSAVALVALVAGQDVEPAEGSDGTDGRWRIARKVAEERVISVNDPDARHTRKSPEARRDG
jgi:hypothetical protein